MHRDSGLPGAFAAENKSHVFGPNPTPTSSDRLQTAKEDQISGRRPPKPGQVRKTPNSPKDENDSANFGEFGTWFGKVGCLLGAPESFESFELKFWA